MQTKGFTLVEMLVVVIIIGILVTIALPQYQTAVDKAKYLQLRVAVEELAKAEELYYSIHKKYTIEKELLDISFNLETNKSASSDDVGYKLPHGGYVALNYIYGYTPEGHYRDEAYVYAIHPTVRGVTYIVFLDHAPLYAGKRFCTVKSDTPRARRLCKSVGRPVTPGSVHYDNPDNPYWYEIASN